MPTYLATFQALREECAKISGEAYGLERLSAKVMATLRGLGRGDAVEDVRKIMAEPDTAPQVRLAQLHGYLEGVIAGTQVRG